MEAFLKNFRQSVPQFGRTAVAIVLCLELLGCVVREDDIDAEPLPASGTATTSSRSFAPGTAVAAAPGQVAGNHLVRETSPYLLSHASDLVEWYPWGSAALDRARQEGKLIFVSVGFDSCHWCHQMAQQVFRDPAVARYLNQHYISIMIDREERPDLDELFMSALTLYYQAIGTQDSGGWPLSVFLTPDGKPLGGGTYFSATDESGNPGFPTIMQQVVQSWNKNRSEMQTNADILSRALIASSQPRAGQPAPALNRQLVEAVVKQIEARHDNELGGFGFDPANPDRAKFPHATRLALLQLVAEKKQDTLAPRMLELTLDRMAAGSIYDHLAGGFHRYCSDRNWRSPRFEKLLADNALLIDIYTSAWEQTQKPEYREVAEKTAEFLLRDLTDTSGVFYSAIDADSDGKEGEFYLWTQDQLNAAIPAADRPLFFAAYQLNAVPGLPTASGGTLEQIRTIKSAAAETRTQEQLLATRLNEIRRDLLNFRQQRKPPKRDDQVVASANGLAIHALAHAGAIFERSDFIKAAETAALGISSQMLDPHGGLLHSQHDGRAHGAAFLDDYAYIVHGMLALQMATGDSKWLHAAQRLTDQQIERFWDHEHQGCFHAPREQDIWMTRTRHAFDSALPAGNSVTARNLLKLSMLTGEGNTYRDRARKLLEAFSSQMTESPEGTATLALALDEYLSVQLPAAGNTKNQPESKSAAIPPGNEPRAGEVAGPLFKEPLAAQPKGTRRDGVPPSAKGGAGKKKQEIVTGVVYLPVDRLPAGRACRFLVRLKIAPPWHINANPAQPKYLKPTVLTLKSKSGTTLKTIHYPKGEEDKAAPEVPGEENEKPIIYSNEAHLFGVMEIPPDAGGQPEELVFEVKYQACQGENCLPPKTLQLKVPVEVAPEGEQVQSVNSRLFPPTRAK